MPPGFDKLHMSVVAPSPTIKLKAGPAIQPVTAISPNPLLAMDKLAKISPKLLPQESRVRPRRLEGNCVWIAKSSSRSTIISQMTAIQTIAMTKPLSWKIQMIFMEGAVVL